MSAIAFVIALVIAIVAAGLWSLITSSWAWRSFAAMVVFALALLLLPALIHA